jgi:hypothetical protein
MVKRAWMVLATLWALAAMGLMAADSSISMSWGVAIIAFGPLAVPLLFRVFFGYVILGSARVPASKAPSRFRP